MTKSTIHPIDSPPLRTARPTPPDRRSRGPLVGLAVVVLAVIPYSTMKIAWLAGSTVGVTDAASADDMHSPAMLIGNGITLGLEVVAVCLAAALTRPIGLRLPAWLVFVIAGGATGLLAPIAAGVPTGLVAQLLTESDVHTAGMDHMSPWVFFVAYGGFCVLAVGFAVLLGEYCLTRWGDLLAAPPSPSRLTTVIGAIGLLPFAVAMLWWGLVGSGAFGPEAMTAISQRTFLVFSGLFPLLAFLAPRFGPLIRRPRLAWLAVWVGCATAVMQPVTSVLLDLGGAPSALFVAIAAATVPGAFAYGVILLRTRVRAVARAWPPSRRSRPRCGASVRASVSRWGRPTRGATCSSFRVRERRTS
ncbi:hypothetical protein [Gordonia phthalatica]|uniref:hypothetical protein n=1 Tax=Gordonia phthalatica TaxID=1136941 RepID=UPI000784E8DB|nr:hypothetical protein [Gordonia phthalatica]